MKISDVITKTESEKAPRVLAKTTSNNTVQKFGDAKKFAETFNPDLQKHCAANIERSLTGDAPTINQLLDSYKDEQVRMWIMIQLEDLNIFAGTKNKMNPRQMMMICDIFLTEYYYLKASEILLFFFQFKSGKYGELYGSVDPLRITSALVEFASYRGAEFFKIDSKLREEEREKKRLEHSKTAITREEHLRRKLNKKNDLK